MRLLRAVAKIMYVVSAYLTLTLWYFILAALLVGLVAPQGVIYISQQVAPILMFLLKVLPVGPAIPFGAVRNYFIAVAVLVIVALFIFFMALGNDD